jgi:hypothetical protein
MWRIVFLGALGIMLGSRARSERWTVLMALLFGLVYGAVEVLAVTAVTGPLSPWRTLFLLGLGLVMAAPVYAIGEIWRRTRIRALDWLRRWKRQ